MTSMQHKNGTLSFVEKVNDSWGWNWTNLNLFFFGGGGKRAKPSHSQKKTTILLSYLWLQFPTGKYTRGCGEFPKLWFNIVSCLIRSSFLKMKKWNKKNEMRNIYIFGNEFYLWGFGICFKWEEMNVRLSINDGDAIKLDWK